MSLYPKLYRAIAFPLYETVIRRRETLSYLSELEKNQYLSRDQISQIQIEKLRKLIAHAYRNVPYYKTIFDEHCISPDKINSINEFRGVPFLTKSIIQNKGSMLEALNYRDENCCTNETGGSTGEPIRFVYPRESYEWRIAAAIRANRWTGWDIGEKATIVWGRPVTKMPIAASIKYNLHNYVMRRQFINAFNVSYDNLNDYIMRINRYKPKLIEAYVSLIYTLAHFINSNNIKIASPQAIITSAETLFDYQRELIEAAFKCRVFNRYGCSEMMLLAAECSEHCGLHVNADNIVIEVLKDNKPVNNGEAGEVVVTDLNNYGMPFIRYKIGDIAAPTDLQCPCGRGLPLIERVDGRTMELLSGRNGKLIQPQTFCFLFKEFNWIKQYQVVQEKRGELVFNIVKLGVIDDTFINNFIRRVTEVLNDDSIIKVNIVDAIPLSKSGKFKMIISKVPVSFGNL